MNNLSEVIEEMKIAKRFINIKNNEIYSEKAEQYLEEMEQYSIYCKEKKQKRWNLLLRKILLASGYLDDKEIYTYLYCFECAAIIMKSIDEDMSKEDLKILFESQNHTYESLLILSQIMFEFSDKGIYFINNYLGGNIPYLKLQITRYKKNVKPKKTIKM